MMSEKLKASGNLGVGAPESSESHVFLVKGPLSRWHPENSVAEPLGNLRRKLSSARVNGANLTYLKPKGQMGHYTTCVQSNLVCSLYLFLVCSPL